MTDTNITAGRKWGSVPTKGRRARYSSKAQLCVLVLIKDKVDAQNHEFTVTFVSSESSYQEPVWASLRAAPFCRVGHNDPSTESTHTRTRTCAYDALLCRDKH